jgi:hypothetical protein
MRGNALDDCTSHCYASIIDSSRRNSHFKSHLQQSLPTVDVFGTQGYEPLFYPVNAEKNGTPYSLAQKHMRHLLKADYQVFLLEKTDFPY